jgi:hypothetical protein
MWRVVGERGELAPSRLTSDQDRLAVVDPAEPVPHRYPDRVKLEGLEKGTHPPCSSRRYAMRLSTWTSLSVEENDGIRPRPSVMAIRRNSSG